MGGIASRRERSGVFDLAMGGRVKCSDPYLWGKFLRYSVSADQGSFRNSSDVSAFPSPAISAVALTIWSLALDQTVFGQPRSQPLNRSATHFPLGQGQQQRENHQSSLRSKSP